MRRRTTRLFNSSSSSPNIYFSSLIHSKCCFQNGPQSPLPEKRRENNRKLRTRDWVTTTFYDDVKDPHPLELKEMDSISNSEPHTDKRQPQRERQEMRNKSFTRRKTIYPTKLDSRNRGPAPSIDPHTIEAYKNTLQKPLVQRHKSLSTVHKRDEQDRGQHAQASFDHTALIHLDSRTKQIHLNPLQKELVWTARQREYQDLLVRVVTCLQSHQTALEKCYTLLALHEEVIQKRLRFRSDTYEDIFHTFYATAVQGSAKHTLNASAQSPVGDALLEEELLGVTSKDGCISLSTPPEMRSSWMTARALLSPSSVQKLWVMYRYMIDSGTKPTARILQYMMGILDRTLSIHRGDRHHQLLTESKAHSLFMDADRFQLAPSEFTMHSYIGVCDHCNVMYLAATRTTDYLSRHERQASPGLYTRLLTGLVRHGQTAEALAMVTTMQNVPMTTFLLNSVLHVMRHSPDPRAAFSMYRAVLIPQNEKTRRFRDLEGYVKPSLHTFSILVEILLGEHEATTGKASSKSLRKQELDFILSEMKFYRIKGNGLLLNKVLQLLLEDRRETEAASLMQEMTQKHILVFDEHARKIQALVSNSKQLSSHTY